MSNLTHKLKQSLRSLLQYLGLYANAENVRDFLKYRRIKTFEVKVNDLNVRFHTRDEYSNGWFFPRYAGGELHERTVTEMLLKSVEGAQCFVDVGANLGWYTCLASKHMPEGKVYGFEMDDLNYALLLKNIAINNLNNVEAYNIAVSDLSSGVVSYKREHNSPSPVFSLYTGDTDQENTANLISVSAITLDGFFENKRPMPDVIKIDVEGAEMKVLRGMKRVMTECRPTLFLEIHTLDLPAFDSSYADILSLLFEYGYETFEIVDITGKWHGNQLEVLSKESVLERPAMVYAVAAKQGMQSGESEISFEII
jgi:FkbM family methyltransferase